MTPAVKALLWANVLLFVVSWLVPDVVLYLGLQPEAVFRGLRVWQPVTYMFLHDPSNIFHIFFNMLALWMFGVSLERRWGSRFFLKYYFVAGVGAALTTLALALVPTEFGMSMRYSLTVGASGAIYGLLLAYGLTFPDQPIYVWMLFPVPSRVFVMIMGAIALLSSLGGNRGGVANVAHLGGLVVGYLYLKTPRANPVAELRYRYVRWRMNRLRRKFDVYSGGRDNWNDRIH